VGDDRCRRLLLVESPWAAVTGPATPPHRQRTGGPHPESQRAAMFHGRRWLAWCRQCLGQIYSTGGLPASEGPEVQRVGANRVLGGEGGRCRGLGL
jgi:hypothetical protein